MDKNKQIDTFNRFAQVSRETIRSLIQYENLLFKANKNLNLVGKSTIDNVWIRHFLDSVQVIDFIDNNRHSLIDIGSGAGFPGLVLAIASKDRKMSLKIKLIEKSLKKTLFLNEVIDQLKLDAQVINLNVFEKNYSLDSEVITARAFKPLEKILELIHNKAKNWKKIFVFLGKTGRNELVQASKSWDIEYKQRVSVTSDDSIVIEIKKLKKR
tara:strand:- start:391 stop:1026 length:636 start_codon:yes stop_codon:yes gene_type:complete